MRMIHTLFVGIAVLFGVVTVLVGSRVLAGADPGYVVFRPLLIYNVTMGMAYVITGVVAWRRIALGKKAAGVIFVLNLVVLGATVFLYRTGGTVAIESVRAMTLRTVVWLILFVGWTWLDRKRTPANRLT